MMLISRFYDFYHKHNLNIIKQLSAAIEVVDVV